MREGKLVSTNRSFKAQYGRDGKPFFENLVGLSWSVVYEHFLRESLVTLLFNAHYYTMEEKSTCDVTLESERARDRVG